MIDANYLFLPSEDSPVLTDASHRRAFVAPVASVHGELGILTLQSTHHCAPPACHNLVHHHLPPHHRH